jgi:pimeloyl-ACP methyl ester carboxylesterase
VRSYAAAHARARPDHCCHYHPWTDARGIARLLAALAPDNHVTLVGHSYGAETAFKVVARTARPVDCLISIDPVGRRRPSWAAIRAGARVWLNVRAEPSPDRRSFDDTIGWAGGKYPRPPGPDHAAAPDHAILADATHGAFRAMMIAEKGGTSGEALLAGRA